MRDILCIILMINTALSTKSDIVPYQINGTFQDPTTGFAYLYIAATSLQPSTLISVPINNNRFTIRGSVKQLAGKFSIARIFTSQKASMKLSEYNTLLLKGKLQYMELILETQVNITISPGRDLSVIDGGELNDDYNTMQVVTRLGTSRNDSLKKWYNTALVKNKKYPAEIKRIQETYNRLSAEQQDRQTSELLSYIAANPSSMLALDKLDVIASMKESSWRKFLRNFEKILSLVPEKWLQSPKGRAMVQRINLLKYSQQLKAGAPLPDYVFRDGNDSVAVRDFRGKFLLLHFWTSWSENCLIVQDDVTDAFNSYKGKGLAVLQISLDASVENWKMALPQDGVAWKQVRCKAGWDAQVERTFEIYGVPTNYLVDQDGKIVATNLWGKPLQDKLAEVMH